MPDWTDSSIKSYEIQQVDGDGTVLSSRHVDAENSEAAARQIREIVDGTDRIVVCLDGARMNEMGIDYWQKRIRRR